MVEWKKLGDVCEVLRGKRLTKSQLSESEGYPVLHGGASPMGYYKDYNRKANTTVVVNTGNAGSVFFYDKPFWSSDACYSLYPNKNILDKFLYLYVYGCEPILKGKIRAGAMPTIDANAIKTLTIPIPSLEEQKRIVGILDTFTDSIENLKQQIAQRRTQYEHYREILLDLEGKPKEDIKKFGDYCVMIKGNGVQKTDFVDEVIGCIHYGQIYTHYGSFTYSTNKFVSKEVFEKAKKASKGDIIMTDTSENVEDICKSVAYLGEDDIAVSNHALIIKHEQNPKFLSYSTLTSSFFNQKRKKFLICI